MPAYLPPAETLNSRLNLLEIGGKKRAGEWKYLPAAVERPVARRSSLRAGQLD
jgi:hypothetical protein